MKKNKFKIILVLTMFIMLLISPVYASNINNSVTKDMPKIKIATQTKNSVKTPVEDPTVRNNDLKSLSVMNYELTPEFNDNITTYYCIIDNDTTSLDVKATAESETSTIKINGATRLNKDENTITITVTPKKGTNKTYTIIAKKQKDNGLKLSSLLIEGATDTTITQNKYKYDIEITQKELKPLEITAIPNIENATVEILGNDENLVEGDNVITIVLTNGDKITTYQVNAKININRERQVIQYVNDGNNFLVDFIETAKEKIVKFFSDKENTIIFLISVAVVLVILILIFIVKIIRRNRAEKSKEKIKNRAK